MIGPSPPTRGSHVPGRHARHRGGSIPAHAGKPATRGCAGSAMSVHPRPRGEASDRHRVVDNLPGPSPPTRGSPDRARKLLQLLRSIPAHAGKPSASRHTAPSHTVHPRPRGEATPSFRCPGRPGVHPRPGGEASSMLLAMPSSCGPSPPTRGSPRRDGRRHRRQGSIPAHAGKPPLHSAALAGLGSIPAHAGKPARAPPIPVRSTVHPRPRGEAAETFAVAQFAEGPSPPTRGSPRTRVRFPPSPRSIPAHAGKPR